ncbi:Imm21 family immunity protein [Micromonospora sp. NPDC047740]|uniref:Imm21 family immunity protein n=1 Tax=Micromonospora sp. NPDC047740 TaxID=3364254 RepID=UPI0037213557
MQSFGGPLILIPRDSVALWHGSYGPDGDDEVEEEETDYWRISEQVQDFAESVDVHGIEALVLANGQCPTTFVPAGSLFVQEMSSGASGRAGDSVLQLLPGIKWSHVTAWNCAGPSLLFDSARFGPSIKDSDCLPIDLPPGRYAVRSAYRMAQSIGEGSLALTKLEFLE